MKKMVFFVWCIFLQKAALASPFMTPKELEENFFSCGQWLQTIAADIGAGNRHAAFLQLRSNLLLLDECREKSAKEYKKVDCRSHL